MDFYLPGHLRPCSRYSRCHWMRFLVKTGSRGEHSNGGFGYSQFPSVVTRSRKRLCSTDGFFHCLTWERALGK